MSSLQAIIAEFRGKYPSANITFVEDTSTDTYKIVLGDIVDVQLGTAHFESPDAALIYAFGLAGIDVWGDAKSDESDATVTVAEFTEGNNTTGTKPLGDPPSATGRKRGRPKKNVSSSEPEEESPSSIEGDPPTDGDKASATELVTESSQELDELSKAKATICWRVKGGYLSKQQEELIEGKPVGSLQRGFVRLIALSNNKGASQWSLETVEAAKIVLKN